MPSVADNKLFDVIIAGGGMVGATLALALHRQGRRVACIDPAALDAGGTELSPSFDSRATACALTSIWLFQNLGLWPSLAPHAAPIENIEVSRQRRWGKVRMQAAEIDQSAFGYVVPNNALGMALAGAWQHAEDENLVDYWGRKVTTVVDKPTANSQTVSLRLDDDSELAGRLLVVADGARSSLREQLGFSSSSFETKQYALVANVAVEKPKLGHAYERFTAQGPMAFLPLMNASASRPQAHYNVVWCGSADATEQRRAMSDDEFKQALSDDFGVALGRITGLGKRLSFPVAVTAADAVGANRVVALGNAAQALHPVAGQGFNLGLRDVASLIDALAVASDCGEPSVVESYSASRAADRQQMLALTTHLATSTTLAEQGVMATAFGLGLAAFGQLTGAKHALALRASGLQSHLPSLCRHPNSFNRSVLAGDAPAEQASL